MMLSPECALLAELGSSSSKFFMHEVCPRCSTSLMSSELEVFMVIHGAGAADPGRVASHSEARRFIRNSTSLAHPLAAGNGVQNRR